MEAASAVDNSSITDCWLLTAGVDGKEDGFEYDSEEDFAEPGGFDMDVSTAAADNFMDDRPRSVRFCAVLTTRAAHSIHILSADWHMMDAQRLQATLVSDPRGCTPAIGEPNVLALLCENPCVTTDALELLLDANMSLASRQHGPPDNDEQPWWPYPLHCLSKKRTIATIYHHLNTTT
jgi:hypothetical protein